jgi:glycosyltransferase involved in cell wall biosynthesis
VPYAAIKVVHFSGKSKPWLREKDGAWPSTILDSCSPRERELLLENKKDEGLCAAMDAWHDAFAAVSTEAAKKALQVRRIPSLAKVSIESLDDGAFTFPQWKDFFVKGDLLEKSPLVRTSSAPAAIEVPIMQPSVLYVVHRYYPYPGGSEYYVHWLASESAARGWRVTVFAETHQGDVGNIKVTDNAAILAEKFDAVIIHGADCSSQDVALHALAKGKVPGPVLYLIIKPSTSPAALAGLRCASLVGCATSLDRAHAKKHGAGDRIVEVVHGIPVEADDLSMRVASHEEERGLVKLEKPKGARIFVSAGGFGRHKRMLELAQAFEVARRPGDRLLLFGYQTPADDEYLGRCRSIEGVEVIVGAERHALLRALKMADRYIMHSEWEGFGLVLLEAMSAGCEWLAFKGAGAAPDLAALGLGTAYADERELVKLLQTAESPSPERRSLLKYAAKMRFGTKNAVDDIQRALATQLPISMQACFKPAPAPQPPLALPSSRGPKKNVRACYSTLLAGKGDYYLGVMALKISMDKAGCQLPLVVAVTADVSKEHRNALVKCGCILRDIDMIRADAKIGPLQYSRTSAFATASFRCGHGTTPTTPSSMLIRTCA